MKNQIPGGGGSDRASADEGGGGGFGDALHISTFEGGRSPRNRAIEIAQGTEHRAGEKAR
jgi:hypothetical protein